MVQLSAYALPVGTVKNGSALWFFGTFEMACLRPAEMMSLEDGLHKGLHASCKRSVKLFRAALQQVHRYLKVTPSLRVRYLNVCMLRLNGHLYLPEPFL